MQAELQHADILVLFFIVAQALGLTIRRGSRRSYFVQGGDSRVAMNLSMEPDAALAATAAAIHCPAKKLGALRGVAAGGAAPQAALPLANPAPVAGLPAAGAAGAAGAPLAAPHLAALPLALAEEPLPAEADGGAPRAVQPAVGSKRGRDDAGLLGAHLAAGAPLATPHLARAVQPAVGSKRGRDGHAIGLPEAPGVGPHDVAPALAF